jgi:hypothetical protein
MQIRRLAMRGHFEQSAWGGTAPLALFLTIFLTVAAHAGGLPRATGDATTVSQCGQSDEGCTRIRGHIPAASERAGIETIGRAASFGPPPAPFMSGLGAAGQAAADAVNRLFFLQVSHDDGAR